jgi:phage major head subunit gpT-like protein
MGVITTAGFSQLLYPGLYGIWGDTYPQYPEEYSQIFDVRTSTQAYEKTLGLTGFGYAAAKAEGTSISYAEAFQGYTHTLTHLTNGLGFMVTAEMFEDDQYGKIRALPAALARSIRHTIEVDAANVLNNGFASTPTGADGHQLLDTDHPLVGGGTYQNELSTAADLSMTSLEAMFQLINDFTDDRGLLINAKAKKLVIHPDNDWTAKQILQSEKDPESNYNAINPARGIFPGGVVINHFLTDPDAWFIITDIPNGLVFYWRRRPAFTKDNDFDTENAKFKTVYRCIQGWDDPRGIVGSPGA